MNFNEALNIPEELEFQEGGFRKKYQMIIKALGYENVKQCIPFTIEQLKKSYREDEHFNNLSLGKWDMAAGFNTGRHGEICVLVRSRLTYLYLEKCKVNAFSCSTGVCILKECARMWVEEQELSERDEKRKCTKPCRA